MSKASGYKGVTQYKGDKWRACVTHKGVKAYRGPFDTPEEAFIARREISSALREGREVPTTGEIKVRMKELSDGRVVSEVRGWGGDRRSKAFVS